MAPGQVATDFEEMLHASRERKHDEAVAARIFGRNRDGKGDRRASAPLRTTVLGSSLASRAGVTKHRSSLGTRDLFPLKASSNAKSSTTAGMPLAARVVAPLSAPPAQRREAQRAAKAAVALARSERARDDLQLQLDQKRELQEKERRSDAPRFRREARESAATLSGGTTRGGTRSGTDSAPPQPASGLTIRGMAGPKGPFTILMQNLAPGTSAADIESVITPVAGPCLSCEVVKTAPIMIAQVVFEDKTSADTIVAKFDMVQADGHTIRVYHKETAAPVATSNVAASQTSRPGTVVIDGKMGFDIPTEMDVDADYVNEPKQPAVGRATDGGTYDGGASYEAANNAIPAYNDDGQPADQSADQPAVSSETRYSNSNGGGVINDAPHGSNASYINTASRGNNSYGSDAARNRDLDRVDRVDRMDRMDRGRGRERYGRNGRENGYDWRGDSYESYHGQPPAPSPSDSRGGRPYDQGIPTGPRQRVQSYYDDNRGSRYGGGGGGGSGSYGSWRGGR